MVFKFAHAGSRILPLAAIAAILAGTAACSPARPVVAAEKATIAYSTAWNSTLVYVAFAKGFFAEAGLDATPQPYEFGKPALQALLDGKADFATAGDTPFAFAVMNGASVAVIAEIQTSNRNEGIIAARDRGIVGPRDLRGRRIGVTPGTTSDFFAHVFLLAQGVDPAEVRLLPMQPADMQASLAEGRVDAVSTWNPGLAQIQRAMGAKASVFFGENLYTETFCMVAGRDYARSHPEAVRRVLRALVKAEDFIRQKPEEARELVAAFLHADRSILDGIWDIFTFKVSLDQGLLVDLEDQTRWITKSGLASRASMPNYLDFIHLDGLLAVRPEAVRVIR